MEGLDRGNKATPIYIGRILNEYSDYDHPLTQQDIIDKLASDYNISMERKAVKRNLDVLEEAGYDIEYNTKGNVYLAHRTFDNSELRLLIDSVLCSKHVTAKQSESLIGRLVKEGNRYFKSNLRHLYSIKDWDRIDNQELFYNIETVDEAIERGLQIHYDYNKYGIDKKLHKSSQQYVSPYQLILHNQHYYLMAYSEYWKNIVYHRLDRITNMTIEEEKTATPIRVLPGYRNGIDYKKLSTTMPYMYSDEPVPVEFTADAGIADQIVDWFGHDVVMKYADPEKKTISVRVKSSPMAMKNWALQYLEFVEVTSPKSIRDSIAKTITESQKKYSV